MTIEAPSISSAAGSAMNALHRAAAAVQNAPVTDAAGVPADSNAMNSAAQALQQHLSGQTNPPQFTVDYLSGLDVMTVRASNGEVVFQLPGPNALRLAQLLKDGVSIESFGIVDASV